MNRALSWGGRRRLLILAAAVALAVLVGVVAAVQVRASQAENRTEAVATTPTTTPQVTSTEDAEAEAARLAALEEARAEAEAAAAAEAEAAAAAERAAAEEAAQEAAAQAEAEEAAQAEAAAAAQAHAEAQAQAAAGHASTWPAEGAAPDCGGPESYEPPQDDGTAFFTSTPTEAGDGSNGNIPRAQMAALSWCTDSRGNHQWLRSDAAAAATRLNEAYRATFGENMAIDLSYRSYADQVAIREHYGTIAALPGTSNHGWGTAFDLWEWEAHGFGSARYTWLVENAPAYGWVAPGWARQNGSNPEYWHFEYVG
ncbi:M15 family metallopeptidase [Actinotalea sp. BY-33]|uniref:M15 family metallopeptidase n=1 Tax=Actinotalea soli TaxID=2819234 RepID=A0A939RVC2_9CELL|nr:M15 family metallopeptidase [Actinotalea soli]MBO1750986.1 M15 family metallopeptidase [Actinotalea soli]